jgi:hypothetical protein
MTIRRKQKVSIVYAGKRERWHIQIVGSPILVYQYWPSGNTSNTFSNSYVDSFSNIKDYKVSTGKPYYRIKKDPNDINNCVERIAAFCVDHFEDDLILFIFPKSVINQMGLHIMDSDWEIIKRGTGISTRYIVKPLPCSHLSKEIQDIIDGTIKHNSIKEVLLNKTEIISDITYTQYTRFDIMDFGDD